MRQILVLLLVLACGSTVRADWPNVLLIISDDQAWTDYGFMGHPHVRTPNLDTLASESLTYTRGYVTAPLCRPSLASIFSGKYVHQHGITGNDPRVPPDKRRRGRADPELAPVYETLMDRIDDDPGIAHLLGEAGYLTLQTGKWWEGDPRQRGGFTHAMTHGDPARGGRHGDAGLAIGREGIEPIVEFIAEATRRDKPFFIWHAPFLPHTPHNPPARLLDKYTGKSDSAFVDRYWAMCEWFDETCGELLDHLDEQGLRESTIVLYVTDNGWIQDAGSGRFAARSKQSPYEGGVRTPVMIRWPGTVAPRRDDRTLVSAVDLAPTVLAACGLEVPESMTGLDLRDTAALNGRDAVFGAAYDHDVLDVADPNRSLKTRFVVSGDWKLLVPNPRVLPDAAIELYKVSVDPTERLDLAARYPDEVTRLAAKLDTWWPGPTAD
jgi:uncharacterized sulfatase